MGPGGATNNLLEDLELGCIYKTPRGARAHVYTGCRHMVHLMPVQIEQAKIEWCNDCKQRILRNLTQRIGG